MSKKIIQALMMPAFVLLMQTFFKFLFNEQVVGLGVSLASIALAQIFPYLFFDNLVLLKVFKLGAEFEDVENNLVTKYSLTVNKSKKQISVLKNLTLALFIIILTLFIITLGITYKVGYYEYHYLVGIMAVLLSISYLIFV